MSDTDGIHLKMELKVEVQATAASSYTREHVVSRIEHLKLQPECIAREEELAYLAMILSRDFPIGINHHG